MEEFGLTGTAVDRGRRLSKEPEEVVAERTHPQFGAEPVVGAPGWRVVKRTSQSAPPGAPAMAPVRSSRRGNPLLPWAAGALLSMVVLALTVADQTWLKALLDDAPAAPPALVVEPLPPEPAPTPEPEIAAPAPSPSRVVPISPDGRGTARALEPPIAPTHRMIPPEPPERTPRIVPISLTRPQISPPAGVQLAGAEEGDLLPAAAPPERVAVIDRPQMVDPEGIRLFIHYSAQRTEDAATAARLAEYLRRRGFEVVATRQVGFEIGSPDLRYFFEHDQAESERLLEDLSWFFHGSPQRAPDRASDFTRYTPKPRPGNVELWLPSAS